MISQSNAKAQVLEIWKRYRQEWTDHIEFKNQKMQFTEHLRENHKDLLQFRCTGSDAFYSQHFQIIEGWINKLENYPNC